LLIATASSTLWTREDGTDPPIKKLNEPGKITENDC
jgi:hypothetical protein